MNYVHINFGEAVAERVVDTIQEALERVALMPLTGHRRDNLTDDESTRFVNVGPTLIAYRHQNSPIEVLFIERGEVDWELLLGLGSE